MKDLSVPLQTNELDLQDKYFELVGIPFKEWVSGAIQFCVDDFNRRLKHYPTVLARIDACLNLDKGSNWCYLGTAPLNVDIQNMNKITWRWINDNVENEFKECLNIRANKSTPCLFSKRVLEIIAQGYPLRISPSYWGNIGIYPNLSLNFKLVNLKSKFMKKCLDYDYWQVDSFS